MRSYIKMIIAPIFILLASLCATTNIQIPKKYLLDNQLEQVNAVANIRMGKGPAFTTFFKAVFHHLRI